MSNTVRKWGNSAAIRIPAAILAAARLKLDQPVALREEGGRIIIEALPAPAFELDTLVAAITPRNRHAADDSDAPRGREAW